MKPREVGRSAPITSSFITTGWTKAGTMRLGNSRSSFHKKFAPPSNRSAHSAGPGLCPLAAGRAAAGRPPSRLRLLGPFTRGQGGIGKNWVASALRPSRPFFANTRRFREGGGKHRAGQAARGSVCSISQNYWQRRTNVWRRVTNPAQGAKRLRA
jgi:hypothetical protein